MTLRSNNHRKFITLPDSIFDASPLKPERWCKNDRIPPVMQLDMQGT
jgi:hypothetical protein